MDCITQLHSYINFQRYLIDEMLYNVPTKNGKKIDQSALQLWNRQMYSDINKLEVEIKRLKELYTQQQIDDAKTYYLSTINPLNRLGTSNSREVKYELENALDTNMLYEARFVESQKEINEVFEKRKAKTELDRKKAKERRDKTYVRKRTSPPLTNKEKAARFRAKRKLNKLSL